jgi:hypothetical protein
LTGFEGAPSATIEPVDASVLDELDVRAQGVERNAIGALIPPPPRVSLKRWDLPVAVFGNSVRKRISRGYL